MANPIYARLQATAQRLIAKYGPGVARRWGQAPGLSPPPVRHRDGCARR